MTDWIRKLAVQERARRELVGAFTAAAPAFLSNLTTALKDALAACGAEISIPIFDVTLDEQRSQIVLTASHTGPVTPPANTVIVHLDPDAQRLTVEVDGHSIWHEALSIDSGAIHSRGVDQSRTTRQLTKRILIPLVFPRLKPKTTDRYLK